MTEPQRAIATARVRWKNRGTAASAGNEIPVRLRVGEVILGVAEDHVLEKEEVLVELLSSGHVRIEDRQFDDRAAGRKFTGENSVGDGLSEENDDRGQARPHEHPERGSHPDFSPGSVRHERAPARRSRWPLRDG